MAQKSEIPFGAQFSPNQVHLPKLLLPELYQQDYLFSQRAIPTVEERVEEEEEAVFEQAALLESEPECELEVEEG